MDTNLDAWPEERSAGQRLMAGFHGTRFDTALERLIVRLGVGGLILFKRNVESPAQLRELCRAAQDCARGNGQPPLIISIDQEGGAVARLGRRSPSSPATPRSRLPRRRTSSPRSPPGSFPEVGINMNLAPVWTWHPRASTASCAGGSSGRIPSTWDAWVLR